MYIKILKMLSLCILLWAPFSYAEFRDPTRPIVFSTAKPQTISSNLFELTGIIIGRNRQIAVINGLYKTIGDEVLGQRIITIQENRVQLDGPSGKITLFLLGKPIKHLSSPTQ